MKTRDVLLDTAETLARTRGFDAFSYADLAKVVAIRKASIHHHFPTKADLALALIRRYREVFFAALGRIEAEAPTAAAQLEAYLALYRTALSEGQQLCLCVAFSAGRDSFDEVVLTELNAFHADSVAWLTRLFERGAVDGSVSVSNAAQQAHSCLAIAEGGQLMARAAEDPAYFDRATAILAEHPHTIPGDALAGHT